MMGERCGWAVTNNTVLYREIIMIIMMIIIIIIYITIAEYLKEYCSVVK